MSVTELKTALTKLIVEEEDTEILEALYAIINRDANDKQLLDEMNAGADEAEADIAAGRVYTMEEVRAYLD